MDDFAGHGAARTAPRTERPFVAAWVIIVAGFAVGLVLWGSQISGVLDAPAPAARVATSTDLKGGAIFLQPNTFLQPNAPAPSCLYVKNVGDNGVFISAKTGSLLSEAQVQHCTK